MRSGSPGPIGLMLMVIGVVLAGYEAWSGLNGYGWRDALPSMLIGLALVAVGFSMFSRARRRRS